MINKYWNLDEYDWEVRGTIYEDYGTIEPPELPPFDLVQKD